MSDKEKHQEIIIIRRGGEAEHAHHGGAWKIAFADFMTAMMALFLVLWLINAANEETKKAVASYFNPVKLVDRNRSVKGLHDAEGVQEIEVKAPNEQFPEQQGKTVTTKESDPSKTEAASDSEFFADPFTVLDEIAAHEVPGEARNIEEDGGRNGDQAINDARGGEAFMDPFSPNFWNEEVRQSNDQGQLAGDSANGGLEGEAGEGSEEAVKQAKAADAGVDEPADPDNLDARMGGKLAGDIGGDVSAGAAGADKSETAAIDAGDPAAATADETASQEAALEQKAADLRGRISETLTEAFGENAAIIGDVSVKVSDGEILISLTDALDISMFELGSAVPSRDLVVALEKIGSVLAEQAGGIRVYGHTDARPFRSKDYDNWRLSASRAQSAYYMLLRGGLEETRVREISGFADRQLLDIEDPFSPRNRRIEVLVEADAG